MNRLADRALVFSVRAGLLIAMGWIVLAGAVPARAGGWHHHYRYRATVSTGTPLQTVNLAPATTPQLMLSAVSLPVTGQTCQVPMTGGTSGVIRLVTNNTAGQTTQLAPVALGNQTFQLVPSTTVGSTLQLTTNTQATTRQAIIFVGGMPSTSTLNLAPQTTSGPPTLTMGSDDANNDAAYQVLTLGFGGSATRVNNLKNALKNKLNQLGSPALTLSPQDLSSILMGTAKDFLSSNGFGIVIDSVLEPFLAQFINSVIQEHQQSQPGQANNQPSVPQTPSGTPSTPAAAGQGQSFTISGRIVLTPASSNNAQPGQMPAQTQNNQAPRNPSSTGTITVITPSGNTAAPSIP